MIEKVEERNKTYFVIRDYQTLRGLFGRLLAEVQRIKSEGDFESGRKLVETYGIKTDPLLHAEVLERYRKLNLPPYAGFINPQYMLVKKDGKPVDVRIRYPEDFLVQMLAYGKRSGERTGL